MIDFSLTDPIGTLNVVADSNIRGKRLADGVLVPVTPGPTLVYAKVHLTDGLGPETLDAHTAYVTADKVAILARNGTFLATVPTYTSVNITGTVGAPNATVTWTK
jgi:hypothetical protein